MTNSEAVRRHAMRIARSSSGQSDRLILPARSSPAGWRSVFTALLLLGSSPAGAQQVVQPPAKIDAAPVPPPPISPPPIPPPSSLPSIAPAPRGGEPSPPPPSVPPVSVPPAPQPPATAAPPTGAELPGKAQEPQAEGNILELTIEARPVLVLKDDADNESGFATLLKDLARLAEEARKAGLVVTGRPFAVIDLTDENRFKFQAMLPIEKDGPASLPPGIAYGQSPSGRAIRFKYSGAYDDNSYVYESIEAYIEEKDIAACSYAIEEFLNDVKDSGDDSLQMYIYYLRE